METSEFNMLLWLCFWSVFISHYRACRNCSTFFYSLYWLGLRFWDVFFFFLFLRGKKKYIYINIAKLHVNVSTNDRTCQWESLRHFNRPISVMATMTAPNCAAIEKNVCSTVGYPDSWYVTLWLTWNHKSSDPFPFLCNFPSSSICFSFAEIKLFTLLFLWKHGIPEGFVRSINH